MIGIWIALFIITLWFAFYSAEVLDIRWLPHVIYWSCIRPNVRRTWEAIRYAVKRLGDGWYHLRYGWECFFCGQRPVSCWWGSKRRALCKSCHENFEEATR
jgi:hypothetical protein